MSYLLVHSDTRGFSGIKVNTNIPGREFRNQVIESAFEELKALAKGRETILPAFNYDFTSTLKFDPEKDLPQVGRIPVEALFRKEWRRNNSPVYSFLSDQGQLPSYLKPFSENSVFSDVVEAQGEVALLGVGFERLTFIHHVEHLFQVPYRYSKRFTGEVNFRNNSETVTAEFHVRPLGFGLDYDFNKIGEYLISEAAAKVVSEKLIIVSTPEAKECLLQALQKDPTYLLDQESAIRVSETLNLLGRPMKLEDFE